MDSTSIKDIIGRATSWLKILADFGVMLIITFIIIDILFPGTTGIIGNITDVIQIASTGGSETAAGAGGSNQGVVGLVALLLFLYLLRSNRQ